jgi:hypothetical protein
MEAVQGDDAALVGLDQEDAWIVSAFAHREDAGGVAVQQFVGAEAAEGPAGAEARIAQALIFWRLAQFSSQWMS